MSLTPVVSHRPGAILAIPDTGYRSRARDILEGLRWRVQEATGGAEALGYLESEPYEALLLDSWLPDLEIGDFVNLCRQAYPHLDLVMIDGEHSESALPKNARRQELLYALRCAQDVAITGPVATAPSPSDHAAFENPLPLAARARSFFAPLPELIGTSAPIAELTRLIRLVAPRNTNVLIQGPTGSGKELVARAVHRLSPRARKPLMVLNCAAIPESLLEAELFGHSRGAFTGAVAARTGRIESADGGTLFLDEIGELPLALQSKLLRFLESGELQRIGENEPIKVDVRVVAATHKPLARLAREGQFREDLYFRLAVFPLPTPALSAHRQDIPALVEHFLAKLAAFSPAKSISADAMSLLMRHAWPGNVRELQHVIERGYILAEENPEISAAEIQITSADAD